MSRVFARTAAVVSALILWTAGLSSAASIVATVNPDPMPETSSATWSDPSFSVSPFNTALGTLTSVEVTLNGSATADVNWSTSGNLTSGTYFVYADLSLVPSLDHLNTLVLNQPVITGTKTNLIGAQSGTDLGVVDTTGGTLSTLTDPADLALFTTGGPNVILDLLLSTSSGALSNPAGVFNLTGFLMNVGADLTVTYNYDAAPSVPEPATILLVGTGLAGLAACGRRRKSAPDA